MMPLICVRRLNIEDQRNMDRSLCLVGHVEHVLLKKIMNLNMLSNANECIEFNKTTSSMNALAKHYTH